ncbi:MATE family efflux transporter [Clostridium taeniosporum]|uniref:Probable multidrug resistance protein NorM n=1 Tax=Clostridium taeniosporum TaxID=394958 RepID=A0A1D7XNU1_9CLOT|nr:MATE family efflux transporter [Clostridium taeniosporum]AOR25012.1 MATE family efflux transporter [Clostridium taeniosporum]
MHKLFNDKEFFSSMFKISTPIVIQTLVSSSLNVVDTLMIGQLGSTAIASVGLANQVFFLLSLLLNGISGGAAIFTSQFFGKKDTKNIKIVFGFCLDICLLVGVLFSILAILIPKTILKFYSQDLSVINFGSEYLRIMGFSYIVTSITFPYSAILRSIRNVKAPLFVSGFALGLNTFLNYGLIFGNWGLPIMEAKGAAVATCISRYVECIILLLYVYISKSLLAVRIKEFFMCNLEILKEYLKTTLPLICNVVLWSFGITTYNIIYARIGTESIAAVNIASTVEGLAFVVFIGISSACNIMIGNKIGSNEEVLAFNYGKRYIVLGILGAIIMGVFLLLGSNTILSFYKVSKITYEYAHNILIIMSCVLGIKVLNIILVQGILRGGGDTRYTFLQSFIAMWIFGVPLTYIGAFVCHLPVYFVMLFGISEEIVKLVSGSSRFLSRKWIHNLVENI